MASSHQDAAVIAAEVSAAMAAQASKEFCCMHEPKMTKLKGGYSADVELVFQSWHMDIKAHIGDCDLDNSAALQLIKDQCPAFRKGLDTTLKQMSIAQRSCMTITMH